jgi:hypothetical protein
VWQLVRLVQFGGLDAGLDAHLHTDFDRVDRHRFRRKQLLRPGQV